MFIIDKDNCWVNTDFIAYFCVSKEKYVGEVEKYYIKASNVLNPDKMILFEIEGPFINEKDADDRLKTITQEINLWGKNK
jgi:hypothetical protein